MRLGLRGQRNLDEGTEEVTEVTLREALRRRSRTLILQTGIATAAAGAALAALLA